MEYIGLITEFGFITVAAAIFIFNARKESKERERLNIEFKRELQKERDRERNERLTRELNQADKYDELLTLIMNMKHNVNKEEQINMLEKQINNVLKNLLYSTNSGRAYFVRYHNGGVDLNNISFLKMSMTNEYTRRGISSALTSFTNQFRALFPWLIDSLPDGKVIHIDELEKIRDVDHTLYEYLKAHNIERAHAVCVCNKNKQIIGFIGISYLTTEIFFDNKKIENLMLEYRNQLELILNTDD